MGVFDDKKFEQLDWMTQMTETIESELNGLLARLPDEMVIDKKSILSFVDGGYCGNMSLSVSTVVHKLTSELSLEKPISLSWEERHKLNDCFRFEVDPGTSIDFATGTYTGEIRLIKIVTTLDDQELQKYMGQKGLESLRMTCIDQSSVARLNEILELLGGCEAHLRNRSARKKLAAVHNRLKVIFKTNEWRIRDTELADKACRWISEYVRSGNLAGFTNFCKLKVMTHNNMPIYSVEEEVL